MKNYAFAWKNKINLKQVPYEEFVTMFPTLSSGIYLEKVDGMLGVVIYQDGNIFFQTTTGAEITDVPALFEYKVFFEKSKIQEAIIPGELVAKKYGTILPFNETQSVVKRFHVESNKDLIHHYPVDIVSLNGKNFNFMQSISFIKRNFGRTPHISTPDISSGNLETFRSLYNSVKKKPGFDGVVARGVDGKNYKIKFTSTADLVIIGAGREGLPAWNKGQVSYLLTAFIDKNGKFRTSSKVGTGFTESKRAALYKSINDLKLYKSNGEIFVKPLIVAEVKYFRYRITPTLAYDFKKEIYDPIGEITSITFSHPSFERLRPDKRPNKYDVRLEQLPEWRY